MSRKSEFRTMVESDWEGIQTQLDDLKRQEQRLASLSGDELEVEQARCEMAGDALCASIQTLAEIRRRIKSHGTPEARRTLERRG